MDADTPNEGRRHHLRHRKHKRASTACQRCRAKKIKCDNQRPVCGTCRENNAQCMYGSGEDAHAGPTIQEVYDRVNHIVDLLELNRQAARGQSSGTSSGLSRGILDSERITSVSSSALHTSHPSPSAIPGVPHTHPTTAAGVSFESILNWPIFQGCIPTPVSSLVLQPFGGVSNEQLSTTAAAAAHHSGSLRHDHNQGHESLVLDPSDKSEIYVLCQKYLKDAHVKNPIFDVATFQGYATVVLENGLDSGEGSCVVMLACALASAIQPIAEDPVPSDTPMEGGMRHFEYSRSPSKAGERYYRAGQKRLGMLGVTLASVQCFYLAGLYEVSCLQPAQAWVHFSQACSRLQIVLGQHRAGGYRHRSATRVLERLYFSCFRTELDLLEELPLYPSGITTIEFPSEFPSLPSWASTPNNMKEGSLSSPTTLDRLNADTKIMEREEEQSWYYYLAAIALRKQANSIMGLLYARGEAGWLDGVEYVLRQAPLQEYELDQFNALLPLDLKPSMSEDAPRGLAYILECRQLQWRQVSYRPLLYYVLHRPNDDPHFSRAMPMAQKCLEYCITTIRRLARQYRYEAVWFNQRSIASAALLILASQVRKPPLLVPEWKTLVTKAIEVLPSGPDAAQDLAIAREILEKILNTVSRGQVIL